MKRLAVIGLDAMSWDYFNKLLDGGAMPFTKQLMNKAIKFTLEAIPPLTPPSWSSIMTGVNPGKHGIFSFFNYYRDDAGRWRQRVSSALDLMHPRVHEMLSQLKKRSIVFNPIPDFPVIPVQNSEIISNLFFVNVPVSYPRDALRKYFGEKTELHKIALISSCEINQKYIEVINAYYDAVLKAIKNEPDMLWVNLNVPDVILHKCPKLLSKKIHKEEMNIYGVIDKIIRHLYENFDNLIIVSDHGFSKYDRLVSVNDILVREGLANPTNRRPPFRDIFDAKHDRLEKKEVRAIKIPSWLIRLIKQLKLRSLGRATLKLLSKFSGKPVRAVTNEWVDVYSSIAFMPDHDYFGIILNEKNKKDTVMTRLRKYSNKLYVYDPAELFSGRYADRGPDIVVLPRYDRGYWFGLPYLIGIIEMKSRIYHHHPYGVTAILGDVEITSEIPEKIPNYAVTTIAMCLMGVPLPKSRDKVPSVERALCSRPSDELNYLSRWNIMVNVLRRRAM